MATPRLHCLSAVPLTRKAPTVASGKKKQGSACALLNGPTARCAPFTCGTDMEDSGPKH